MKSTALFHTLLFLASFFIICFVRCQSEVPAPWTQLWQISIDCNNGFMTPVGANGYLCFDANEGNVTLINSTNGAIIWSSATSGGHRRVVVSTALGVAFFPAGAIALDLATGAELWSNVSIAVACDNEGDGEGVAAEFDDGVGLLVFICMGSFDIDPAVITAFKARTGVIAWTWRGSNAGGYTPVRDHIVGFQPVNETNLHGISTLNGSQLWAVPTAPYGGAVPGGPLFYISSLFDFVAYFPTNGSTAFTNSAAGDPQLIRLKPTSRCEAQNPHRDVLLFIYSNVPVMIDALTGETLWVANRSFSYSQSNGPQYSFSSTSAILWTQTHYVSINIRLDEAHNCTPYIEWIVEQTEFILLAQPTSSWIFGWPQYLGGSNFTVYNPRNGQQVFSIPLQLQTNYNESPNFIATDTLLIVTSSGYGRPSTQAFELPVPP